MSDGVARVGKDGVVGVLICDDNEALRELLSTIVCDTPGLGVVGEAADGNEAIVEAIRLEPDVIMLDLAMPNRNGLEAIPELRRLVPKAQIIVFSGFASAAVAEQALGLGAACYLEKGASPDVIVATIDAALASAPSLLQP